MKTTALAVVATFIVVALTTPAPAQKKGMGAVGAGADSAACPKGTCGPNGGAKAKDAKLCSAKNCRRQP